jgi:uncharacterized protein (TIGR00369 family)
MDGTVRMGFPVPIPFVELLGCRLDRCEDGQASVEYSPRPEHLNSFGVLHGGVVMSLLDVALSWAARSLRPELGVLTIEMKTSFMQACPGNEALRIQARLLQRTTKLAFVEGHIHDSQGRLCAHATGTFKYAAPRAGAPGAPP